jgi:hypothetical protein
MSGEDGPTKAGCVSFMHECHVVAFSDLLFFNGFSRLDIMASTSADLEQGYEKILRYCSHEFRQIGRDSQLEVSPGMREAVLRLRTRPELLT